MSASRTMALMSRPIWSVPSQCAGFGARNCWPAVPTVPL